ncbi:MAG: hypothetical protein AAGJ10_17410 [Bacteroidota bacterium]
MPRIVGFGCCLFMLGLGACSTPADYRAQLNIERQGWDTLHVHLDVFDDAAFGEAPVPDSLQGVRYWALNAQQDTLATTTDSLLVIADADLGSYARILVEACAAIGEAAVCEQQAVTASPKRSASTLDLDYPGSRGYEGGRYTVQVARERQVFGTDSLWEALPRTAALNGYLEFYIEGRKDESTVTVPIRRFGRQTAFRVDQLDGYTDFEFFLRSALLDESRAEVGVDVYVGAGDQPSWLETVVAEVKIKTEEERADEVMYFVQQAAAQLSSRLSDRQPRVTAYIDAWVYDPETKLYEVEVEVLWRERREYVVQGVLRVLESGNGASFEYYRGNRRGNSRWNDRIDRDTHQMGTLALREEEQDDDVS